MYKSKLEPILKLVCKGDVFTTPEGPQTCLIDLPKDVCLYYRIGVSGLPMDIKGEIQEDFMVKDQCILSIQYYNTSFHRLSIICLSSTLSLSFLLKSASVFWGL